MDNTIKKNTVVLLIVLIVCFLIGTFFDLTISNSLYSKNNIIGCFFTVVGIYPFFSFNIYASSFVLGYEIVNNKKTNIIRKVICAVIACVYIVYIGGSLLTKDGVGMLLPELSKTLETLIIIFGILCLGVTTFAYGYSKGKKCKDIKKVNNTYRLLICLVIAYILMTSLKSFFNRPRYRVTLKNIPGIEYTPWYKKINDIKSLVLENGIDNEEIRSFPSGHGLVSGCCVAIFSTYFKNKKLGFIIGTLYMSLVMLSRIILGAHFLSDVTFGAIVSILAYIAYLKIKE